MKDNREIIPFDDGRQQPGVICAANESRFAGSFLSEPLTAFAVGWKDPTDLLAILDFLAPSVPVGRRFEFKKAVNSEAFLSETDDVRSIGAEFKRVDFTGETVNEKTLNKGLTIRVDHDSEEGADWRERYTQLLLQRLYRNEVRRAIALLAAAATDLSKTWTYNDSSNKYPNPDKDVRDSLVLGTDASGIRPNRIAWGEGAWDLRADAFDSQNNPAGYRSAGLLPEEVARKLLVDAVRIISARYQSSASAKTKILGSYVYMFYALDGAAKDEPSNIKRFVTPTDAGNFRVYLEEKAKFTDISVEHYSNIVITSTLGIRRITAS